MASRVATRSPSGSRRRLGFAILGVLLGIGVGVLLFMPVMPQKLDYHGFHDARTLLGIPNALNVVSNLAFAVVGWLGLRLVAGGATSATILPSLRPAYATLFTGLLLTAFGSAYYHWSPSNATLIWDRLPIAIAFMALFATVMGERVNAGLGARALIPLVVIGVASVLYWAAFDDLRPYGIVQFYPVLAIPVLIACFPSTHGGGRLLLGAIACYVVAKVLEEADGAIYGVSGWISGHTLKHLAAALGAWLIYRMVAMRRPLSD